MPAANTVKKQKILYKDIIQPNKGKELFLLFDPNIPDPEAQKDTDVTTLRSVDDPKVEKKITIGEIHKNYTIVGEAPSFGQFYGVRAKKQRGRGYGYRQAKVTKSMFADKSNPKKWVWKMKYKLVSEQELCTGSNNMCSTRYWGYNAGKNTGTEISVADWIRKMNPSFEYDDEAAFRQAHRGQLGRDSLRLQTNYNLKF